MQTLVLTLFGVLGLILLAIGMPLDLLLVIVVLGGLYGGSRKGLAAGLVCGAAQDFLGGMYPGLHLITKALAGLMAGTAEHRFFRDNPLLPAICFALATIFQNLSYGVGGMLIGWNRSLRPPAAAWLEVIANTVAGMLIVWLLRRRRRRR